MSSRHWILCGLLTLSLSGGALFGQETPGTGAAPVADPNTYRFSQPIPVIIRRSNNAIAQGMLVAITREGITIMSPQGRSLDYANKTFRSVRSPDGSFFYNPSKDDPAEFIGRLNQLNPSGNGAGQTGPAASPFTPTGQPGSAHAQPQPAAGHNAAANSGSTFPMPFPTTTPMPNSGHSQSSFNSSTNSATEAMNRMMAHSQATSNSASAAAHNQAMENERRMAEAQRRASEQAAASQAHSSSLTTPMTPLPGDSHMATPGGSHSPMPPTHQPGLTHPMPAMPNLPSQTLMYEYECSKCKHRVTSATEIKAGHKCASCGVIWGQVQDENGRVTSSTPAGRIGGGVGIVVTIIGIIAAIVKKSKSA